MMYLMKISSDRDHSRLVIRGYIILHVHYYREWFHVRGDFSEYNLCSVVSLPGHLVVVFVGALATV
jgi:hypothetical protein